MVLRGQRREDCQFGKLPRQAHGGQQAKQASAVLDLLHLTPLQRVDTLLRPLHHHCHEHFLSCVVATIVYKGILKSQVKTRLNW